MPTIGEGSGTQRQVTKRSTSIRRRSLLSGAGAATAALAGCTKIMGGSSSGESENAEIHVVTGETNSAAKKWFDRMANEFMNETGTAVTMDYSSLSPTKRISTLIQTGNTPELATLDTGQAAQLATRDQLAPVGDLTKTYENEYGGSIPDNVRLAIDGNEYTIPLWTNPTQIWYWGDVYEEYSLERSAGLTWDEYLEISKEINSSDMYGTVVPSASTSLSAFTYWNFLKSNGGNVATRQDGDITIALDKGENKQRAVETARFLKELHQYSPKASDFSWGDILQSYVSRNAAHCIYGPRAKLQVIDNTPKRKEHSRPHFPVHNGSKKFINNGGGWVLMKNAEYKEEAKKFIEFTARKQRLIDFLTAVAPVHNFPTMTSIAEMDAYRNSDFIKKNFTERDLEIVAESFKNGVSWGGETDPYNQYGPSLFTSKHLGTLLYEVNIKGESPEQAVSSAASKLRDSLESMKQ